MTLQRADLLDAPPVVGQDYLVPAILWAWKSLRDPASPDSPDRHWWPVIGPVHDDQQFFHFSRMHYHVDVRFVSDTLLRGVESWYEGHDGKITTIIASPLNSLMHPEGPPAPKLRTMRCARAAFPFPARAARDKSIVRLNDHFAGTQCARGKFGWICPHRKVSLGSMVPDQHGVITCFLHGLRVDAKTGLCVGPAPRETAP